MNRSVGRRSTVRTTRPKRRRRISRRVSIAAWKPRPTILAFPRPLRPFGHNQWPALPDFREQMIDYYAAMSDLGAHLLRLLARSLEMPEDWFERFHSPAAATLRLIK